MGAKISQEIENAAVRMRREGYPCKQIAQMLEISEDMVSKMTKHLGIRCGRGGRGQIKAFEVRPKATHCAHGYEYGAIRWYGSLRRKDTACPLGCFKLGPD